MDIEFTQFMEDVVNAKRVHKEKPFQCPYCLKYYKRKGVVKNHILIHYSDPNFIAKKDFYKKIVDNLDNKNSIYLYDFYYKNTNI